jgi:hypothetical protein
MLEVHLPHKPIHGVWEFFFHLFTITIGLLIATQIESCVEWRHHVHLAEEARTQLRIEIENNLKDLKQAQPELAQWRKAIDDDLEAMQRIQERPEEPKNQHTHLSVNFSSMSLRDTAWRTAQSTGSLGYMPYEEAERYANVYQAEQALLAMEDKPLEDATDIHGLITRFHWGDKSRITREQADILAERFGRMRLHLLTGDLLLKESIEVSEAFLQNRPFQSNFEQGFR